VVPVITTTTPTYSHDCDHGFCTICGSVWPCSRSSKTTPRVQTPIARPEYFAY
jgi:hypothetical protein